MKDQTSFCLLCFVEGVRLCLQSTAGTEPWFLLCCLLSAVALLLKGRMKKKKSHKKIRNKKKTTLKAKDWLPLFGARYSAGMGLCPISEPQRLRPTPSPPQANSINYATSTTLWPWDFWLLTAMNPTTLTVSDFKFKGIDFLVTLVWVALQAFKNWGSRISSLPHNVKRNSVRQGQ